MEKISKAIKSSSIQEVNRKIFYAEKNFNNLSNSDCLWILVDLSLRISYLIGIARCNRNVIEIEILDNMYNKVRKLEKRLRERV